MCLTICICCEGLHCADMCLNIFSFLILYCVHHIGYDRGGHRNSYDNSFPPPPTYKQGYSRYNSFDAGQSSYQRDGGFHRHNSYHGGSSYGGYGGRRASEPSPFYRYNSDSSSRFSDCQFKNTTTVANNHNVFAVGYMTKEEWTKIQPRNERMERYVITCSVDVL